MCVVCGCNDAQAPAPAGDLHYGHNAAGVTVHGLSTERSIQLEADVLGANQHVADHNRAHFKAHGIAALNLVSSPGAGKTTLLCATLQRWREQQPNVPVAVIEGDQQTTLDADRIRATGVPAIQVNTGKGCHLDARMVADAFARLPLHDHHHHHHEDHADDHVHGNHGSNVAAERSAGPPQAARDPLGGRAAVPRRPGGLLLIENVGNLVCPALLDLGEAAKVAILSVTEGDDKPLKYPDMFAAAKLLLINKIDLLPYVSFDVAHAIDCARRVNPAIEVLQVSATRGDGLDAWLHWLGHVRP